LRLLCFAKNATACGVRFDALVIGRNLVLLSIYEL
jgi:hypothetical protein